VCISCRKPSRRNFDLCLACQTALVPVLQPCASCALPLPPGDHGICGACLVRTWRITRTVAAFAYVEPASALIGRFKYQAGLQHGRVLGELLLERLEIAYRDQPLPGLLVPVPLHPSRLRERGFNQALVLARQLGSRLHIPIDAGLFERVRQTPAQQGLTARERKQNLRGAFSLRDGGIDMPTCNSIALIDDVVTTMSTVHELARVLRRSCSDAPEIHVWCLARA
jgi:ComF family protein